MHAGDAHLWPYAEEALKQVHGCQVLVNDLHRSNVVVVPESKDRRGQVFFVDFSQSQVTLPSLDERQYELQVLKLLFE